MIGSPPTEFGVVELRRYELQPGKREELIRLFDREFLESQEACGMLPIGHYRDLDDPDSFIWFRGFADLETRRDALHAFYVESRAWQEHRDAANATMIDSDNVLLLRSARSNSGFDVRGLERPAPGEEARESFVAASVFMLDRRPTDALIETFEKDLLPGLQRIADRIAYFVTEERPNTFRQLPVREGEWAFVVAGICPTRSALDAWSRAFDTQRCEVLHLQPAPRSLYR